MKITLKEIAEIAGVHRSTVDKVIHGRAGVSDDVRKRIQKILDELEYRPNMVGRALQKQSEVFKFAAILLKVDALEEIQAGINRALEHYNNFKIDMHYHIVNFMDSKEQADIIHKMVAEGVHGIVVSPIYSEEVKEAIDYACGQGVKVVTTNSDIEECDHEGFVGQDAYRAGRIAARLMGEFTNGSGKVAIVASRKVRENSTSYTDRVQSFIEMMGAQYQDITLLEPITVYDDPKIVLREVTALLNDTKDLKGIYVTGGSVKEVGKAIKIANMENEIKVICFENYSHILQLMKEDIITCTLTSDLYNQGYLPIKILVDNLIYGVRRKNRHHFTKIEVLVKESIEDYTSV